MSKREKIIIDQLENLELKNLYHNWRNLIDNREKEMLENINSYVEKNKFKNAVFLCGSAHRKAILNKIKLNKNTQIKWNLELP